MILIFQPPLTTVCDLQQAAGISGVMGKGKGVGIFECQPNPRENLVFPDAHPPVLLVNAIQVGPSFLQRAVLAYTHGTIPPLACT